MSIDIIVIEHKSVIDCKTIAASAEVNIEVPIDGSWSVQKLEKVRNHLRTYLNNELPKCLIGRQA